jgi:hypothetical protein
VILLALATCAAPADRSLVGLWESTTRGPGSVGHTLEFRPDGSFVSSFTVLVQQAYRFDARKLSMADDEAGLQGEAESARVEIQGDVLVLTDTKGATLRKERVGPVEDPARPIVGVWKYRHDGGVVVFERYTAGGQMLFRLPMSSNRGCYTLNAGTLTVDAEATRAATFKPRVEGDGLELRREGKEPTRYRRAPGVWYPRD